MQILIYKFILVSGKRLNEYISHYEPLTYNTQDIHKAHLRAKRSVSDDTAINLNFKAHSRDFSLVLKRDLSVFSNDLEVHGDLGPIDFDTSHIYQGHLRGNLSEIFVYE